MSRRVFCKLLLAAIVIFSLLVFSDAVMAQGRSAKALEHVKTVQERHTERLMAQKGVVGTAVGLDNDNNPEVLVLLENGNEAGIPAQLDGVKVRKVVTGKIYALPKPPSPPGQDKKNPPPTPPTGLTATAVGESVINLDWDDNSESDLAGYNIYYSTSSGGPYDYVDSVVSISNYSDTGLVAGTTYYYVVTAVDTALKESDNSVEASATTHGGSAEPPAAPSLLTATAVSSNQIDLSWADNADNENGFKIEREITGTFQEIATVGANITAYSDTGLSPSTTYTYRVFAYNTVDDSDYAGPVSATTKAAPVKPPLWCERPVPIGVSTGHPEITAGTIGCRVRDAQGNVYALSNNHVYANENQASLGDNVLQPGALDGGIDPDDAIGTLYDFEPINFHPRASNTMDAAIALTGTDMVGKATPAGGYGLPNSETVTASVDMAVQKYGRSTGLQTGQITAISATVRVYYSRRSAIFVDQILIGPGTFSAGGDSGSLIVTDDDNCKPVGLLFAGSDIVTIANPIDVVLTRFGVTIDGK